ncbi:winged helix-turn-helix domain-containing protein [Streptomyces sp. NPDC085995]|uniref:winged helix-turn-helix domain-containing protein n=1 Tax=Streptomyces sp. NPDC085995 TaxID=3154861 RepID=UPI00341C919D
MKWKPGEPKWRQLYEVLRERILDGTYPPGSKLPSVVQLTGEFDISEVPARHALRELRAVGLAEMHVGEGTFVTELPEPDRTAE